MQKSFVLSQVFALGTVTLWSSAFVFTKVVMDVFSVSSVSVLRCAVASLCLGAVVVIKKLPMPRRSAWFPFLIAGTSGFGLYMLVFNQGLASLNPTTSCILISTSPIMTAVMARIWFKEQLGILGWCATGMAFCGILLMTLWEGTFSISTGIGWMLFAAFLISLYNVVQRRLAHEYSAIQITAYSFFVGTVQLLFFLPEAARQVALAPLGQTALVCFLGVFPSATAYLLWAKGLSVAVKTSHVTNYMFLTPFLALLLEYIVTGDLPGIGTFAGGSIILLSLLLLAAARKR